MNIKIKHHLNDTIFIDTKRNANNTRYYVVKSGKDKGTIVCINHRKRIKL